MTASTHEILAEKLFDQLQTPARSTPDALKELFTVIQSNKEKPAILANIQERLKGLSEQEQTQIDVNLKVLELKLHDSQQGIALLGEVALLRAELQALSKTLPPAKTAGEWLQQEFADMRTDFSEGSLWKKAGYVTGAIVGYKLVTGLWKKIRSVFTSSEKTGFFGKLMSLGATAVGGVAGAIGVSQLLKGFGQSETANDSFFRSETGTDGRPKLKGFFDRDKDSILPDAIENVVEPIAEGGYRGLDDVKKFFGPAFEALYEHKNVRAVMEHKEEYDSDVAYVQAIVTAAIRDGIHFAFDGTTGFLSVGEKLISLTGEFGTLLFGGMVDGELNAGDLLSVYIEGVTLYATSFVALKILTFNRFGKNASMLLETGLWPVYTVKRTLNTAKKTVTFTHEVFNSKSATRLGLQRRMGAFTQRRLILGRFTGYSQEGLASRHAFTLEQMQLLEQVNRTDRISAEMKTLYATQEAKSVRHFQEYLKKLVVKNLVPEWLTLAHSQSSYGNIAIERLQEAQIRDIVLRANPEVASSARSIVPDVVIPPRSVPVSETGIPSQQARAIGETVPNGAQTADDVVPNAQHANPPVETPMLHTSAPRTAPQSPELRRMAVGDGVVPEPRPSPVPSAQPSWIPRVVREDGTRIDALTGEVIETAPAGTPSSERVLLEALPVHHIDDVVRQAELAAEEWKAGALALKQDLLGANATPAVHQAVDTAFERCRVLGFGLDDTAKIIRDAPSLAVLSGQAKGISVEAMESVMRIASSGGVTSVKRISQYVISLGAKSTELLLDPTIIRTIAEMKDFHPKAVSRFFGKLAAKNLLQGVTADQLVESIRGLSRWQKAGTLARGLHIGFAALDSIFLTMDVVSLVEMKRRHVETIAGMEFNLTRAGFTRQGMRWVHQETGASLELKTLQESVSSLSDPQAARVVVDGLGTSMLLPCVSMGPAGLAIGVTLIVVYTGISTWEQSKNRNFLEHTPTSILAALTTAGTVVQEESDIIADMSTWMISDVLHPFSNFNPEQKRLIRKKMMAVLLWKELSELEVTHPGMTQLVTGGKDMTSFLDERSDLLASDFDTVIKPYVAARLFQRSNDGTVTWKNFKDLRIDDGVFDFENVDATDMRLVLREAIFLYSKHVIQREYQNQLPSVRERATVRQKASGHRLEFVYQIAQLAEIHEEDASEMQHLEELGSETVFGQPMSALPQGATAIEKTVRTLVEKFDRVDEDAVIAFNAPYFRNDSESRIDAASRDRMLRRDPQLFSLSLPEELREKFTSPVRLAHLSSESLIQKNENPEESLKFLLPAAQQAFDQVKNVAWAGHGPWQAQEPNYKVLADYANHLSRYRELDPMGLRQSILTLGERWNWSSANPGLEFMRKRNDAFHVVVADLAMHLSYLQSRIPSGPPLPAVTESYYEQETTLFSLRNAPSITLNHDSKGQASQVFTGVPNKTTSFDAPSFGHIKCVSVIAQDGSISYEWTFTPKNDLGIGLSFLVSAEVDNGVHTQHERAIRALRLERKVSETGKVSYARAGYTGEHVMQSDGTVFYTGGEHNGKRIEPATFVLPSAALRQDYFERSITLPTGQWFPIATPLPAAIRASERVELKRMQDLVLNVTPRKEGASLYFPATGWMNVKLTLLDGTVIEGRYSSDLIGKISPYITVRRANVKNYMGHDFDRSSWKRSETPSEEPVSCMILKTTAEGASKIARIELADYLTTSRGYKHVYRFP